VRNLEITIFENGVGIGGTESTKDVHEDLENDSIFGKEYENYKDSEKWECIISELSCQIKGELDRIAKEGK